MRIHRERKQTVTVEFGLPEARNVAKQLAELVDGNFPRWGGTLVDQLRQRLEYHVTEAEKGNPRV